MEDDIVYRVQLVLPERKADDHCSVDMVRKLELYLIGRPFSRQTFCFG